MIRFNTTLTWTKTGIPLSATLPETGKYLLFVLVEVGGDAPRLGAFDGRTFRELGFNLAWSPHDVLAWAYVGQLDQQVREKARE